MDNKQIIPATSPEMALQAAQLQSQNVDRMTQLCGEMAKIVFTLQARLETIEGQMQKRVTVTAAQANTLAEAVQARARQLCDDNDLPYTTAGKTLRAAIWRDFCAEYAVQSRHDLPAIYLEHATAFIGGWSSYAAIIRIRGRLGL